jgi:oligopeptide transport system substrate-binding protein
MDDRFVQFPWEAYYRSGLISRRQFVKLSTLLGTAAVIAPEVGALADPIPADAAVAPLEKQVLRYPDTEPLHFDPATMESRPEILVAMALFDPLITFNTQGQIVPLCAESWNVSSDGLTYTFHLRSGMQWSDGHPVTASDFEYAWKRVADPATASDYAPAMYPIKGALEYNKGQTKTADGVAITALNATTLQVVLVAPAAYFPRLAATQNFFPVPRWQIEKYGKKWVEAGNHVSNGAFALQAWEHDKELTIVANPKYYGKKPTLQKVVYTISDSPFTTSLPAYENGELDITDQIQPADITRVRSDPTLSKELHKFRWSGTGCLFCDTTNNKSPLSDVRVRQALYLAIDHNRIATDVLRGIYDPALTVTPPGTIGYLSTPPLTGGVDAARKLLAEAGYPDGKGFPGFTITWGSVVTFDLVAQALQQMWLDTLNVRVSLQRMDGKGFNAAFNSYATQPYDAFISRWGSDYEDPANWANILFDSSQDFFHCKWHNAQFDSLARAGSAEANPAKRKADYEAAEKILNTELPAIPLFHLAVIIAIKPYVQDFTLPAAASEWSGTFQRVVILDH